MIGCASSAANATCAISIQRRFATTAESASAAIKLIDEFKKNHGLSDFVYASDEMYLAAGQELPTFEECGDFEQIENGVGLFRRFEHDFMNALEDLSLIHI